MSVDNYFKCICGEEVLLHPALETECDCGCRYWVQKNEIGEVFALLVWEHTEDDSGNENTIKTYKK